MRRGTGFRFNLFAGHTPRDSQGTLTVSQCSMRFNFFAEDVLRDYEQDT
jgi:hypothetical protein